MPEDSSVHQIRLAGPWSMITDTGARKIKMPASWRDLLGDYSGTVIFKRSFNSPTGLQNQRLFIVLPETHCRGVIRLNNVVVGAFNETQIKNRFEITRLIQPHNHLEIELSCLPESRNETGLHSPVILEIVE